MAVKVSNEISMAVDLKKYRIRIHKATLHLLGDPKYIQLLVSPEHRAVAIRCVEHESSGDQSHKVTAHQLQSDNSIDIYSRNFIETLCSTVFGLDCGVTYRLNGNVDFTQGIAVFPLSSMKRVDE